MPKRRKSLSQLLPTLFVLFAVVFISGVASCKEDVDCTDPDVFENVRRPLAYNGTVYGAKVDGEFSAQADGWS